VPQLKAKDARSLTSAELFDLRKRAVAAVASGRTRHEVAQTLGLSRQAVARWVDLAQSKDAQKLAPRRRGRPMGGKISKLQSTRVLKQLITKLPDDLKLPYHLWTREAVALLIKRTCRARLSVWTVGRLLKQWGLTPQKPARRAYERDPEAVRRWLEEEYPKIRARARQEHAIILWEDEMGVRSDAAVARTYGLKGKTPVVPITGRRFKCNMIASISNRGKLNFMLFTVMFTAPIFLKFLRRICTQMNRKIFLIVDGHPAHRAAMIKRWLQCNQHAIELFFLPGFSPDLNPSEYLNNDVKANTVGRKRPRDERELKSILRGYLKRKQHTPEKVRAYFRAEPVRYAAL
jgi:transposase